MRKLMPTKIKPTYKPSYRVFELLANRFGIPVKSAQEFTGHEMGEFLMYWTNTGKAKTDWDTTCLNWMARNYENKKEQMAKNRVYGKAKPNLFQETLDILKPKDSPTPAFISKSHTIIKKPIPGENETMSATEALDILANMRL